MEAWKKQASAHMSSGPPRRIQLFKKLLYIKISESDSIAVHSVISVECSKNYKKLINQSQMKCS